MTLPNVCVVVVFVNGPHDGDRFITPKRHLIDGDQLTYFGTVYTTTLNPRTQRWEAALSPICNTSEQCGTDGLSTIVNRGITLPSWFTSPRSYLQATHVGENVRQALEKRDAVL